MFGKKKSGRGRSVGNLGGIDVYGRIAPNQKLQDEIVRYFVSDDIGTASEDEVTQGQRVQIEQAFKNEQVAPYRMTEFLLKVLSPIQDLKTNLSGIYQQIVKVPMQKQILAVLAGYDRHNWQQVDEEDLRALLSKPQKGHVDYRTPVGFDGFRREFLEGIRDEATEEQMLAYLVAMDEVERRLYGRRFDYYQQMVLMASNDERPDQEKSDVMSGVGEIVASKETAAPVADIEVEMKKLDEVQGNEVLRQAMIEGDAWRQGGVEYKLTTQSLVSAGMAPAYVGIVDGVSIFLAEPFRLSDGKGAIIAYVNNGGAVKVRGYCQNMKTGMWHYVPETIRGARGEGIGQIGEGYGGESTLLPLSLQAMIAKIVEEKSLKVVTVANPDFLLAGTAAAYNTQQEYREALMQGMARGDYYREVDGAPVMALWKTEKRGKNAPQLISVNNNMAPDFQNMTTELRTYSVLVGQEEIRGFESNDGQLVWGMGNDEWGRAWCNNIEVVSPITSTGCRRDWMDAGDMTTPLYENSTQAGDFGDARDVRRGMVGMWGQYVSRVPLIQEYVKWRSSNAK